MFSKKNKCKTCRGRFLLWFYRGIQYSDECKSCFRKKVKRENRRRWHSQVINCIVAAKVACKCGLRYKAGSEAFRFDRINRALFQICDWGIQRGGEESVIHQIKNRGIYCIMCEPDTIEFNKSSINTTASTSKIETKSREEIRDVGKEKEGGENWWDKI